jgi:hypothetical protein
MRVQTDGIHQGFQYFSSVPVLHYLQVVLCIKIWTNDYWLDCNPWVLVDNFVASNEIAMSPLQLKYVPLRTLDWVAQSTIKVNLLLKVLLNFKS